MIHAIEPRLFQSDMPLFYAVVQSCFPIGTGGFKTWFDVGIWFEFYRLIHQHHGLILVEPASSGKTSTWKVLALVMGDATTHTIDPKPLTKEQLYGSFDASTWNEEHISCTII
jgi:hypothetical protein